MSSVWLIVVLLLGWLLFGLSGPTEARPVSEPATVEVVTASVEVSESIQVNGHTGVVLDASTAGVPGEAWTPALEDLQAAEDAIEAYDTSALSPEPMMDATRQYVGSIDKSGDRLIGINAFCDDYPDWQERLVQVDDGGGCYWQATYNVDTGTVISFTVNGVA